MFEDYLEILLLHPCWTVEVELLLIIGIVGFIIASGYLVLARSNYDDYVAFLCVVCQFSLCLLRLNSTFSQIIKEQKNKLWLFYYPRNCKWWICEWNNGDLLKVTLHIISNELWSLLLLQNFVPIALFFL